MAVRCDRCGAWCKHDQPALVVVVDEYRAHPRLWSLCARCRAQVYTFVSGPELAVMGGPAEPAGMTDTPSEMTDARGK